MLVINTLSAYMSIDEIPVVIWFISSSSLWKFLCHNFVAMEFDNEVFNLDDKVVNHNDAKAFIDEEYMDCEFPLHRNLTFKCLKCINNEMKN